MEAHELFFILKEFLQMKYQQKKKINKIEDNLVVYLIFEIVLLKKYYKSYYPSILHIYIILCRYINNC
jgi:hypothetical protein